MAIGNVVAKVRAGLLFLIFSVVAGVLAGVMSLPMLMVTTGAINTTNQDWNQVPLNLITPPQPQGSKVYMADGSLLTVFADQNRQYVPLSEISKYMQEAQVAIEDHRFYEHGAIDPIGMVRAALSNFTHQSDQGASSITQQYVKMVRVQVAQENHDKVAEKAATEQTIARKIIEMRYAMAVEKTLTKDEILERYLNMAYYGDQTYGVESAAQHYFGVSAADLDLPQAAMIAGLVQSPGATDPVHNPDAAIMRRNTVLDRMAASDIGMITQAEADAAKAVPWDPTQVKELPNGCQDSKYPFICDYLKRTLTSDSMPGLGATSDERWYALQHNGLTIQTVIDPKSQNSAQKAVSKLINARDPVIGVAVLLDPKTGLIKAMAQSRPQMGTGKGQTYWNYAVGYDMGGPEGFQAGSTFKMFTLANALSLGVPFSTMYSTGKPVRVTGWKFMSCSGPVISGPYTVRGTSGDHLDLLSATANSVNTYFIQLEHDTGICGAVKMAQAAGVKAAMPVNGGVDLIKNVHADTWPSFTLGVLEVAPLTMAGAFATFANKGKHCDPIILKSVTSLTGDDIAVPSANCKQTINANVAAGVVQAMQGVMARGTGAGNRIAGGYPQAGKSGTTDQAKAVAFGGFTPNVVGFATIGIDKKSSFWKTHRQSMGNLKLPFSGTVLRGFGAQDAGRIWQAMMNQAVKGTPKTGFPAYHPVNTGWHSPNTWTPTPTPTPKPKPTDSVPPVTPP